jgi:nitroimidazol reductase NimA-like FMN-containing flavoprotein (pyridoxamine 5'-phosphate oxidase superfamily)
VIRDGTPHVTPVWFDFDGTFFYFKTARGRVNDHILRRHPRVGFDIQDPGNAYHYVLLQGSVVGETEENAVDWIQSLNEK